jgi:toxin ParE1/3/4
MRYRFTLHPLVERDLENIQDFIAPVAGVRSARRIAHEIKERIKRLCDYPHIGTVRSEIAAGLRAIPSAEKAVTCFTVNNNRRIVHIVCVTYAGQDWQEIARKRQEDT